MVRIYEYIGEETRDFPTVGIRDVKKGDTFTSETEIFSEYVKDITPQPQQTPPTQA